jgi:hypothetical protein
MLPYLAKFIEGGSFYCGLFGRIGNCRRLLLSDLLLLPLLVVARSCRTEYPFVLGVLNAWAFGAAAHLV